MLGVASGQTHKVSKPEQVVRAVGVYEWTGDLGKPTASRLVPITVFIDGELHDGGVYLPRPVPFALEPGNEYEVERAGVPQGLLRIDYAGKLDASAGTAAAGEGTEAWLGYGTYKAESVRKEPALHASRTQLVITSSHTGDDHPSLTKKTNTDGGANPDADRPTMRRRPGSGSDSAGTPSSGGSSGGTTSGGANNGSSPSGTSSGDTKANGDGSQSSADDVDRPTLRRRSAQGEKQAKRDNDVPMVKPIGSLNDDPDRPNLHRGRPAGRSGDDEVNPPKLVGAIGSIHQVAAVSDAANRPEHDFARPWADPAERAAVLARMQALAYAQLASYTAHPGSAGEELKKPTIRTSRSVRARSSKNTSASDSTPVALLDEQLQGYVLSYGALPVYVYTARTAGTGADLRYVTIVAQDEVGGDSRPVIQSVTDAAHMDRTPWMRFVDVVDAEASNRASLLFELRGSSGRVFALYRVLGDQADQLVATSATP